MLTTNSNQALSFYSAGPTDSTVYINPGTTRVGNYILDFRGGYRTFSQMTDFTTSHGYQYSVLCIQNFNNFPDTTNVVFAPVDSTNELVSPNIGDSTFIKPLGLFLFYGDGTNITLTSSSRIQ
jgi:hypothetical protein